MGGGRPAISQDGPDVLLAVRVQPRAPRNQLVMAGARSRGPGPETITVRLTAPPVEGAANAACRAYLGDLLGIAPSRITLVRGEAARRKLLRIRDADAATVLACLKKTPPR
ncbi:MAG: DUF167 domain-containing protein [candidate division NC10 bacterium]|nr:DUF167 domain-containing protein [candidate division NC10 bacterium]